MISDADMVHLKTLARLELNEADTEAAKQDLNKILSAFEQIRQLDTSGVTELTRPVAAESVFRQDVVTEPLPHAAVAAIAVETENGFFKVPRTVDAGE